MISLRLIKKQILILFVFSLLIAIGAIIHGVYMDLDFLQIRRLTIEGILLTFLIIFPAVLFLEWVFDFNNKERIDELKRRLSKLEKSERKRKK